MIANAIAPASGIEAIADRYAPKAKVGKTGPTKTAKLRRLSDWDQIWGWTIEKMTAYLDMNEIDVYKDYPHKGGYQWEIDCPLTEHHTVANGYNAAVFLNDSKPSFHCFGDSHDDEDDNCWAGFRLLVEKEQPWAPAPNDVDLTMIEWSDLGNGKRIFAEWGEILRYSKVSLRTSPWFMWDGQRWLQDSTYRTEQLRNDTLDRMKRQDPADPSDPPRKAGETDNAYQERVEKLRDEHQTKWKRFVLASKNGSKPDLMLKRGAELLAVDTDVWDRDPWKLNVLNGILDLQTFQLGEHDPMEMMTKLAKVAFDRDAMCPRFMEFITRIIPAEYHAYLQVRMGLALTGISEKAVEILYGSTNTAKSTLVNGIFLPMLGDYAATAAFTTFMPKSSDAIRHDLVDLKGKRLISVGEPDKDAQLSVGILKQMLSVYDGVTADRKFEAQQTFYPVWNIILHTNHLPRIGDHDQAIWERLARIDMQHPFTKDEQLAEGAVRSMFEKEYPGILNWCLEGLKRYHVEGSPKKPDAMEKVLLDWRTDEDDLGQRLDGIIRFVPGVLTPVKDIWARLDMSYDLDGIPNRDRVSKVGFAEELRSRYVGIERSAGFATFYAEKKLKIDGKWKSCKNVFEGITVSTERQAINDSGNA